MKLKRDAKFGEESTCRFKVGRRNLTNFDLSTQKFQNFSLYWASFEQIIYCSSSKSTEELSFINLKKDAKFQYESTCRFKFVIKNLTNFEVSTRKFQNFSF